jgi:hypothetical protein
MFESLIGNNHLSAGFLVHCAIEDDSDGKHCELLHHQRGQVRHFVHVVKLCHCLCQNLQCLYVLSVHR